jgi:glycosyltransferase involved in cell wall biosynthesis
LTALPTVAIVMSAYNAERYLAEQIDSILSQHGAQMRLYVRDDGSTDGTAALLDAYAQRDFRLRYQRGSNLGAGQSFLQAIADCPFDARYYGFADADDVWLPDKIEYSIALLEELIASLESPRTPAAICTRLRVVDQALQPIGQTPVPRIGLRFDNALVDTVTSGASMLMNPAAFELLRSARPAKVVMHDAWAYLVLSAFGALRFGERPTILYRQHATNVVGTSFGWKRLLGIRLRRLRTPSGYWDQALQFRALFGQRLDPAKRAVLERYVGYRASLPRRLAFALNPSVRAQSRKANLFYRLLFLLGRG